MGVSEDAGRFRHVGHTRKLMRKLAPAVACVAEPAGWRWEGAL